MSLPINMGDVCVIHSTRESIIKYNGIICQVLTYYPAESDEKNISNLHDVLVTGPAFNVGSKPGTFRLHPSELIKIDLTTSCVKIIRNDNGFRMIPPGTVIKSETDINRHKTIKDRLRKIIEKKF